MKRIVLHVTALLLSIFLILTPTTFASIAEGSSIATPNGLVRIENLKVGDKVLGYDVTAADPSKRVKPVSITNIRKHGVDTLFTLYTAEQSRGWVAASPSQLFCALMVNATSGRYSFDFVQAQALSTNKLVIDDALHLVFLKDISQLNLSGTYPNQYVENIMRDKRGRIISSEKRYITINVYALEVEQPHTFLVWDHTYHDDGKPRLLVTHNGIPALGVAAAVAFGSTPATISFLEASLMAGGLGVSFGPAGIALGMATGAGLIGYQLFKKKDKNKDAYYVEKVNPGNSNLPTPEDPRNSKDNKHQIPDYVKTDRIPQDNETVLSDSSYKKLRHPIIKGAYVYEKNGRYYHRDTFHKGKGAHLEVYNSRGEHLGKADPCTGQLIPGTADAARKIFLQ